MPLKKDALFRLRRELTAKPDAKPPYAGRHSLSLKCDPDRIQELRAEYPDAVLPGYYSDGRTWTSVDLDATPRGPRTRPLRHELRPRLRQAPQEDAAGDSSLVHKSKYQQRRTAGLSGAADS